MDDFYLLNLEKPQVEVSNFLGLEVTIIEEEVGSKKEGRHLVKTIIDPRFIVKDFFWFDPFLGLVKDCNMEICLAYLEPMDANLNMVEQLYLENFIIFKKDEEGLLIFRTCSKRGFTFCRERAKNKCVISIIKPLFKE